MGYGSIGSLLSVLAESLGMNVLFYDVVAKLPLGNAQQVGNLHDLLGQCDIVSLHVPDLPSTRWMIGAKEIAALKSGKLLGAAVDVFPSEPKSNKDEFQSPLRGLDNVLLTPHIGGSTMEAQANIGLEVAEKLVKYSDNGSTITSVNFPEVALPEHPGRDRILHVHKNVPGVMSAINQVFSDAKINVAAQYLQTDDALGYVVIDTDAGASASVIDKLRAVPGTMRVRVLF